MDPIREDLIVVGPAHPHGGGIAQHVATLSRELDSVKRFTVRVESWQTQYPKILHRSQVTVQEQAPEVPLVVPVERKLRWYSPLSWASAGFRSRASAAVLFNVVTPFHAIPFAFIALFSGGLPGKVAIVHNAVPHEQSPLDLILLRLLVSTSDAFVVHDVESESILSSLTGKVKPVVRLRLPSPWSLSSLPSARPRPPRRLNRSHEVSALFFGNVRPYKGLYVLLEALRSAPCVRLTVAGNFWGQEIEIAQWLADSGLTNRVSLKNGYVPSEDIPSLFRQADIVVLPYLTGTASVIPQMAFSHGVPVIVTNVGSIAAGVETGVNGFIVAPNSSRDLAKALATFADSAEARKTLEVGAQKSNTDDHWDKYREAVINLIELVAR